MKKTIVDKSRATVPLKRGRRTAKVAVNHYSDLVQVLSSCPLHLNTLICQFKIKQYSFKDDIVTLSCFFHNKPGNRDFRLLFVRFLMTSVTNQAHTFQVCNFKKGPLHLFVRKPILCEYSWPKYFAEKCLKI